MIVPGIGGRRKKSDELKRMTNIGKFMRGEKVDVVKKRKERSDKNMTHNQPERELRNNVVKELRKRGIKIMRLENSVVGKNNTGFPDLWFFNINKNKAGFIELKSEKGILEEHQKLFRELCLRCNINHFVVRSISEAMEAAL